MGEILVGMQTDEARALTCACLKKESLRSHSLSTAAIMKALASRMGKDPDQWEITGLLHDIDYELVGGDVKRHGEAGYRMLIERGTGEDIAGAVRRHNDLLFGDSEDPVDVSLRAADNISGLIIAAAAVKGGRITEVSEKTLRKKFKEKAFASGCRREKMMGITRFMELPEFFPLSLGTIQEIRVELGLG